MTQEQIDEMQDRETESAAAIAAKAEQIGQDLGRIRRALRRPLEAEIAAGGLTLPQTAVMRVVVRRNGLNLKELSDEVSLAHSTVSGIVHRLERRGMIERRPAPTDGRTSRIYPTAPVTEFVRERIPQLNRGPLEAALACATGAERESIGGALRRLRELLEICDERLGAMEDRKPHR